MANAKLIDTGNSSNRIDMIILGDGYQEFEFDTYEAHARALTDYLFEDGGLLTDPFGRYKNFFNVHIIYTASNESGADDPTNGITRDTAFDTTYLFDGVTDRLLSGSVAKGDAAVSAEFGGTDVDPEMLFMTVNSDKYGGAGGKYATYAGGNSDALEVAVHEVGHSFAHLADEYFFDPTSVYSGPEPVEPNVTADPSGDKWSHWLGYEQEGIGEIGVYEGARYEGKGVYRPSDNSKMRNLDQPFDVVSIEQFILGFYEYVDPLDGWTDNAGTVRRKVLSVDPVDEDVIDIRWKVDGKKAGVGDATTLNLTKLGLAPGTEIEVSARAYDPTEWVRIDKDKLEMTVEWDAVIPNYVNQVRGTAANDRLNGVAWDDKILGKNGNDRIDGKAGEDNIIGGGGNDRLIGGKDDDRIKGGGGNDTLKGGKGDDLLRGNGGSDLFDFSERANTGDDVVFDFRDGVDTIKLPNGVRVLRDVDVTQTAEGVLLDWGSGTALLLNMDESDISRADFV